MADLITGVQSALAPSALLFTLLGTVLGIVFGALPGLTSTMAIALMIPLTYGMDAVTGMGMLVGAFCGGTAGGIVAKSNDEYELQEVNNKLGALKKAIEMAEKM